MRVEICKLSAIKEFWCSVCTSAEELSTRLINLHWLLQVNAKRKRHRRKKIHNCAGCQKSFGWPEILKRHMETHNRERIFYCVQCKKSFGSAGHLNQHMLTHSGEKMQICSECKKLFGRAGILKTHMLIHSGEKPTLAQNARSHLVK